MGKHPEIYEQAKENFLKAYNIPDYDLAQMAQMELVGSFLTGSGGSSAERYAKVVASTMAMYFDEATTLRTNGSPTLTNFKIGNFIEEFEKLVAAKYNSELDDAENGPQRPEFAGASKEKVLEACVKRIYRSYNKTLPDMWAKDIRKGSAQIEDMRLITDNLAETLRALGADKESLKDQLTNIVAAYEAMKQVRKSREGVIGFFWKLFNGDRNALEQEYCQTLENQVNSLKGLGYDVDGVTNALNGKTVLGRTVKTEKKVKEAKPAVKKEVQKSTKPLKIEAVSSRLEEKLESKEIKEELASKINNLLPSNGANHDQRELGIFYMIGGMKSEFTAAFEAFDEGLANNQDPKKLMSPVVRTTFKRVKELVDFQTKNNNTGKQLGTDEIANYTATITKMVLEKYSPLSLYSKELGGIADDYIEKNVDLFKQTVAAGDVYSLKISEIEDKLRDGEITEDEVYRTRVFAADDTTFAENTQNKSEWIADRSPEKQFTLENK